MTLFFITALCRYGAALMPMLVFGACLMRELGRLPQSARAMTWQRCATVAGLSCVVALLPLQAINIAGDPQAFRDAHLLWQVATLTSYGQVWIAKCLFALLLSAGTWCGLRNAPLASLSCGVLIATGLSGHAAMESGAIGLLHMANNVIHILCAAFWLGALIVVLPLLRRAPSAHAHGHAGHALARFSWAGHWAVAGVMLTGAINTWLILHDASLSIQSPYQCLLALKILLALLMTALALANRYYWVPRLSHNAHAITWLRRQATVALGSGLVAVALVSLLGMLSPT